jgi:hypothetical protein
VAVDELQLIVVQEVTQETNDKQQLMPMITTINKLVTRQHGSWPMRGIVSEENLAAIAATTIDAELDAQTETWRAPEPCPRGPLPNAPTRIDRMSRKLHTKAGAEVYAARTTIVEPILGQIKHARGFRQFCCAGFRTCKAHDLCVRRTTF